ncbi:unnamed protein product, partial [Citrullus colocynthis]
MQQMYYPLYKEKVRDLKYYQESDCYLHACETKSGAIVLGSTIVPLDLEAYIGTKSK